MNKNGRQSLLRKIIQAEELQKIAQEAMTDNVDGDKVADDIFNKLIDGISLEELERDAGN
jgi:hypothetical protein